MFFRNMLMYRVDLSSLPTAPEELEAALNTRRAKPCPSGSMGTYGFAPAYGKGEDAPLAHGVQGFMLLKTQKEERIIPPSVIKDMVDEKVEEIEAEEGRKVYRKERDQLTDAVIALLMPRAFIKRSSTLAAIDIQRGVIYINTSSFTVAEELLGCLREALGKLPPRSLLTRNAPANIMTHWVKSQNPGHNLRLGTQADFSQDEGTIKVKEYDLASEEITQLLECGHMVSALALDWADKLSFTLNTKLQFKQLRFSDLLHEQAGQDAGDDRQAEHDASLILMMQTFREMTDDLFAAMGGLETSQDEAPPASA